MVVFTCNKCGESLKKKDVEKHCNTRCRGAPFLTCVDCLKDFREDFVKHTLCVTEDDRYSAKGLKGLQSKQKSKQQIWVEVVQDCISRAIDGGVPGITPSVRSLLLYLQEQATLPDKAKPFANFVKNARRTEPIENINFVWKILEQARNDLQAKQKAEREAAEAEKKKSREQQHQKQRANSSERSSDDSSSDDEDQSKSEQNGAAKAGSQSDSSKPDEGENFTVVNGKKDKKKKRMVSESESVVNGSSEFRKSKKSKKNPKDEEDEIENTSNLNNAMDACHLTVGATLEEDKKLSKKEKKEKKKREKYEAEMKEIESAETGDQIEVQEEIPEENEGKKGKKKKNKTKKNEIDGTAIVEDSSEVKDKKKKDKKNKKREHEDGESMDTNSQSDNGKLNETLHLDQEDKVKFSWDTAILQVLESQGGEISLKRLSKKVIGEYLSSLEEDAHIDESKITNKLHKKLDKMHNVLVHKDKVKLKTSRD